MDLLPTLIKKRGQIKSRITRMQTYFNTFEHRAGDLNELKLRLVKLKPSWQDFETLQSEIELLDESPEQLIEREQFENNYFGIVSKIEKFLQLKVKREVTETSQPLQQDNLVSQIKLPTIKLPTFNGKYDEWLPFVDTFTTLIHENATLSAIQKFYYLKSSLNGEAAHIIESLATSNDNYTVAWELLKERFENKRILIQSHVKGLFNLSVINKESALLIRDLCDGMHKHLRALEMLGQPTQYWDTLILHVMSHKLDPITRREWEMLKPSGELPTVTEMTTFLKDKCQLLETLDVKTKVETKSFPKTKTSSSHVSTSSSKPTREQILQCNHCKGPHLIYNCEEFLKLSDTARTNAVKQKKLCFNCLRSTHNISACHSRPCRKCGKKHHTLLHMITSPASTSETPSTEEISPEPVVSSANYSSHQSNSNILLSTARIQIFDAAGQIHECRALLDSGSQSSFITTDLCRKLQLSTEKANVIVSGIGHSVASMTEETKLIIQSIHNAFKATIKHCLVIPKINQNLPLFSFNSSFMKIPPKLVLADPLFNRSAPVDVLLGADIFYQLLCAGQIRLQKNEPILQKSVLGWIISGPMTLPSPTNTLQCNFSKTIDIDKQLKKFWEIEEDFNHTEQLTSNEAMVEKFFKQTTTRHEDKRFIVKLPFKENLNQLGDSRSVALKRFLSLERRLSKDPELKTEYVRFMNEYNSLGHMTETRENASTTEGYFLPHHGVVKDSSSTKLRVVFDGSSKSMSGISLNDVLFSGPTIQEDLFSIIMRFRKHRYVLTSDIAKMYRQIWIHEEDQRYQQILWRSTTLQPIRTYTLKTVTYGTTTAPYLATRCLKELAQQEGANFPIAAAVLQNDFYVDDCLTGAETIEEAIKLREDLSELLSKGGFDLRKWRSNVPEIIQNLQVDDTTNAILTIESRTAVKTLGLLWHSNKDVLQYSVRHAANIPIKVTKRHILSTIAQIFDPLGLLGPVIIIAKIILQRLWQYNLGWDEAIPMDLHTNWTNLNHQLQDLNTLDIPRHALITNPCTIELHGFSDASEGAYGACLYIRSMNSRAEYTSHLLCAKSRVAPLKSSTIPRLELCGALLLARLSHKARQALKISFDKFVYWSDSTITLAWIHSESNHWKAFVANRVAEIHELTSSTEWRHVRTHENPADLLSRGVFPREFKQTNIWWNGPPWLQQDEDNWPILIDTQSVITPEAEVKRVVLTVTQQDFDLFNKYSSFRKLQRVVAYCHRFLNNSRKTRGTRQFGCLTVPELNHAQNSIIKFAQLQEFNLELQQLQNDKQVHNTSKLLNLHPFLDKDGIIRVGGRIHKSLYSYSKKHPIVLPASNRITTMIVEDTHKINLHVGPQGLLAILRERFWPISGRNLVKKIVRQCILCFKNKPTSVHPLMGELPEPRVTPSRPFKTSGVDYAGPFLLRDRRTRGAKQIKAYICLFVCFATKAIHLEIVSDLTTQAFLAALRRFVARRGKCLHIYSDNATNFKGADAELREFSQFLSTESTQSAIQDAMALEGMTWHFIPARSPHCGGLWEAGVKMTKHHLKRVIGNTLLTFEDMSTIITQIEACLNSRPLSPLSDDPNDLSPLTPAHFLIGEPLTNLPEPSLLDLPTGRLDRYQQLQKMYQDFWQRWSKEYISELQLRQKWRKPGSNIFQINDLVLMKDENQPPLKWKLGRIIALHPGTDAVVRVATVRTSNGTTRRTIHQMCRLPIYDEAGVIEG